MAYDIGLKIGIDGEAEFRKSISGINEEYKTLKTEMASVTSAFDKNDQSQEKLTKQNEVLTKQIDLQKKKVEECNTALEKAKDKYGENDKVTQSWQRAVNTATTELNKLEGQLKTNNKVLDEQESKWDDLSQKINDSGEKIGVTGEKITGVGAKMTVGLTAPIVAAGAAAGVAAIQFDDAGAKIQSSLGLTEAEAQKLEDTAKNVWSNGFGGSLEEVTDALLKVKQNMKEVADGAELEKVTEDAITLAQTFDADVNEVTRAGNNLMVNFGLTSSAAFDLMAAGAQNGLNFSQEMFDNLSEYSSLFADMGYSAEEYFQILVNGSEAGVYNLDYINDVMKEFQIRVKDGSSTTSDAMAQMSESTQAVWQSFLDGNGTVKDVSNSVLTELKSMDDQVVANQLGVSLYGTKWEDMESGAMYSLTTVGDEMSNVAGTMDDMVAAQSKTFDARWNETVRESQEALLPLGETLLDLASDYLPKISAGIESATKWFDGLSPSAKNAAVALVGIAAVTGPVTTGVGAVTQGIGNLVEGFGTVRLVATNFGEAITLARAGFTGLAGEASGLFGAMTALAGPLGIIVGIVGAMTVGGIALHEVVSKGKQLTEEQIAANDAFVASSKAVSDAVTSNVTSRSESIKTSQDEAIAAQELSQKLFDLADKQNKSGAEMQLLSSYVAQFNQLMPNANLLIDEQTGALNLTRDATNELIAAETERIQKQAVNEALVQNAKDQLATKRELNEATIRQTQLEQEYAQGLQAVIDGTGNANEKQQKANELWVKYQEQLGPVNESVSTLTAKQGDLANEQSTLNGLLQDPSGWNAYINGTNTANTATVTFVDGSTKKIQEFGTTAPILAAQTGTNTTTALQNSLTAGIPGVNTAAQAVHDTVKTTTDPLTPELTNTGTTSTTGMMTAIIGATPGVTTAAQGVHDTVKTTTDPLVPELTTTGTDATTGAATAMVGSTPKVTSAAQGIHDTAKNTTDPLVPELTKTGGDSGQGLGQALGNQNEWVGVNSSLIHDTTKNTTDPLVSELSTTGNDAGYGLGDKLGSNEEHVKTKAGLLYSAADGKISPLPGVITGYGGDSGQGLINGMDAKKEDVGTSADGLVQKVLTVFKKGFGINSPAKETYAIGAFTMEGFLNSLIDGSVNVMGFLDKMIADIKNAFANGNFNLKAAINFVGSGAAEFFKSIGIGGSDFGSLVAPVGGAITSGFGYRDDVGDVGSSYHQGIDIGAAEGTPVGAAGAGTVTQAGWNGGYGNSVTIDHGNGLETLYGHLSEVLVNVGDLVSQLQTIGLVGSTGNSTGPHLHFSVIQNGEFVDPSSIFGFDVGSRYIPRDMVAMIHEGEMIVPKAENPYANSGGQIMPGGGAKIEQTVNIHSPTALSPAQTARLNKRAMQELALSF